MSINWEEIRKNAEMKDAQQYASMKKDTLKTAPQIKTQTAVQPEEQRKAFEREVNRLNEQRRQAQVELDTDAMNRIDAQLKQLRADAGKQSLADRVGDVTGAWASSMVGTLANIAGTVNNVFHDPDYNRRQIAAAQKTLETGRTSDGKVINEAQRKVLQESIARMQGEIHEWEAEDSTTNRLYKLSDTVSMESAKFKQSAKEGLGKVGEVAVDLGVLGGQLLTDVAANAMLPGSGLVLMGTRQFGGSAQEARQSGATLGQQLAYGAGSAAVSVLTEKLGNIGGVFGKAYGSGVLDKAISKLAEKPAGKLIASALSEASEELLEAVAQPLLQKMTYNPEAVYDADWLADALYSAALGGVLGGVGAAVSPSTYRANTQSTGKQVQGVDATSPNAVRDADDIMPKLTRHDEGRFSQEARRMVRDAEDIIVPKLTDENGEVWNPVPQKSSDIVMPKLTRHDEGEFSVDRRFSESAPNPRNGMELRMPKLTDPLVETAGPQTNQSRMPAAVDDIIMPKLDDGLGAANVNSLNTDYDRLQAQSDSFHPEGANAARPVDVPTRDFAGQRVSKSASTVMGAEAIPDSVIPQIEQMVADGQLSYTRKGDSAAINNARRLVADNGFDGALERFRSAVTSGKVSKDTVVLGQTLMNNAANAGDGKALAEILSLYQSLNTNAGQAVQAASILRKLSPEAQLYGIQKTVSSMNDNLQKAQRDFPGAEIDTALIDKFLAQTDQAGRDAVMEEIYQNVADQVPSTWRDKWNAWRYLAMLGNPRTHIRNIVGNVGFQPVRIVKDKIATAMEAAFSAAGLNVERTKSFMVSPALYRAAWNDYSNASGVLGGSKYDNVRGEIQNRRRVFNTGVLEAARKGNGAALELEDAVFKRITYADALAGYLQANGVTAAQMESGQIDSTLLSRARDYAAQEALKATYQDSNVISERTSRIAKSMGVVGDAVMPFQRTPANILSRALEYSPAGLIKSLTRDLAKVKAGKMSASQAMDNIAAGLTGSGLFGLGMHLFALGLVTGGQDGSEDDKWSSLLGHQGYALELPGGTSITLDWLAPEALPFFMGVEFMSAVGEDGFQTNDIIDAVKSVANPMLEMSMLQGVNDLIESVQFAEEQPLMAIIPSVITSYFSQAVPTLFGQLERSGESVRMTTYTDKNSSLHPDIQYAIGRASSRIPGLDYAQIPYIDAWGREEESGDLVERTVNNLLNPAYVSQVEVDDVERELQRLRDATGETSVFPDRVERYITVDGERKDLTAKEYVSYAKALGQERYNLIRQAISSPAYRTMSDSDRTRYIDRIYDYSKQIAKSSVSGYTVAPWVENARNAQRDIRVSPVEYMALYEKYGSDIMCGNTYEKVKTAVSIGLTVDEYADAKRGLDANKNGSVTQEEAQAYLDRQNFSQKQKADMWTLINKSWKKNPYK